MCQCSRKKKAGASSAYARIFCFWLSFRSICKQDFLCCYKRKCVKYVCIFVFFFCSNEPPNDAAHCKLSSLTRVSRVFCIYSPPHCDDNGDGFAFEASHKGRIKSDERAFDYVATPSGIMACDLSVLLDYLSAAAHRLRLALFAIFLLPRRNRSSQTFSPCNEPVDKLGSRCLLRVSSKIWSLANLFSMCVILTVQEERNYCAFLFSCLHTQTC